LIKEKEELKAKAKNDNDAVEEMKTKIAAANKIWNESKEKEEWDQSQVKKDL